MSRRFRGSRDVTVDIYCLAASLYYAVTGERPAEGIARKLNNTPLIAPQQHNREMSTYVNQAILKGMELEAQDRPRSMGAWLLLLVVPRVVQPPSQSAPPLPRYRIIAPMVAQNRLTAPSPVPSDWWLPSPLPVKQPDVQSGRVNPKSGTVVVPWNWLLGALTGYVIAGFLLSVSSTPLWAWAVTVVWAVAWAVAVSAGALAWAFALAAAWLAALAWAGAWAGAWAVALVAALAVAEAANNLPESFNRSQAFLILFGFSAAGLGLGWLLRLLFYSAT